MARVKASDLAGRWYAGEAQQLRQQVDDLLAAAGGALRRDPLIGLVVPHAGYQYSGRAAAAGYACVAGGPYRRVVLLGPSHYAAFRGVAFVAVEAFATLLGEVPVDEVALATLMHRGLFRELPEVFADEHAVEIQLPFLQRVLPQVPVVPLLVGEVRTADLQPIADALEAMSDGRTLFVVSSDFVHYGRRFGYLPFPSSGEAAVRAALRQLDMGAIECICAGDATGFQQYVDDTGATICGRRPLACFLTMLPRGSRGCLLSYYTSLDVTGDFEHSVSYASIAFAQPRES